MTVQVTIKTGEMRAIYETMSGLAVDKATGAPRRLPAKMSYWVGRMLIKLQGEYEASEKARLALAEQFGTKNAEGTQYEFDGEAAAKFNEQFVGILNTELTLDLPQIFIGSMENVEIEPGVLMALDKLITE